MVKQINLKKISANADAPLGFNSSCMSASCCRRMSELGTVLGPCYYALTLLFSQFHNVMRLTCLFIFYIYRAWDHHDIISVKPEYNDSSRCSTSARLASIAPYSGRKETSVYATDIISGITIHCKVFVDRISRIRIFHHAVKIDLDEVATLRVHAFDDEGNLYSLPCLQRAIFHSLFL